MMATASVVICAYTERRWDDLRAAIGSAVAQLQPDDECLVVIDHNEALLARVTAEYTGDPAIRVLTNMEEKGLSGARNSAVYASRCDVVAFLDDDATAGPGWLAGLRTALASPDVMGAGGAVTPHWPKAARPGWFPPEFDWVIGCTYLGMPDHAADVRNVIGAGMAFRREAFEIAGTFSAEVGRVGTVPTGCEETELCIRIRQAKPGLRIRFLPEIEVLHRVTPERLTVGYFLRRCLGEGRSKARVSRLVGAESGLSNERAYVRSVLPRGLLRDLSRGVRGDWRGFAGAALIVAGVACAALGYTGTRLSGAGRAV